MKRLHSRIALFRGDREKYVRLFGLICGFSMCINPLFASTGQPASANQKKSLKSQLTKVEQLYGVQFLYQQRVVDGVEVDPVDFGNKNVDGALEQLLKANGFRYKKDQTVVTIAAKRDFVARTQNIQQNTRKIKNVTIEGVIKDEYGDILPGANVSVKGSSVGCAADNNGKYTITFPQLGNDILVFSFVGMENQEVKVGKAQTKINVVLKSASAALGEVVITTGYFAKKKDSYTGTASTYSAEQLKAVSSQNMLSTLSTLDPSFKLQENLVMGSDPNSLPEFTIRGGGSLESEYGNSPNQPTFILDGFEVSAQKVFDLDPNRVASMTLLKDAAATAIYGSRASNGVVVIETKTPAFGKLRVNYNFKADFSFADLSDYNLMNAEEKLAYEKAAGLYSHKNVDMQDRYMEVYNQRLKYVQQGINTNWISKPVNSMAFSNKHFLMIDGGDSKLRYSLSVNYNMVNGVIKKSGRDQIGVGAMLQYRTGKFKFANDLTYNVVSEKNSPYGYFNDYARMNPYYYPYDENGNPRNVVSESLGEGKTSSVEILMLNPLYNSTLGTKDQAEFVEFNDNLSVDWEPIESVKVKAQISFNKSRRSEDKFLPSNHTSFYNSEKKGSYSKKESDGFRYDANVVASFNKLLKKNMISVNGLWNVQQKENDFYYFKAVNFPNDNMDHIGMGTEFMQGDRPSGDYLLTRLMGVALNANYGYDNRYMADLSIRSDASSMFGANKRWGTFGSVGLAWNVHNESFLKGNKTLNELKLRGSVGTTGGQNFYPFQALNMFSYKDPSITNISYDGYIGALAKAYGNDDLEWQKSLKRNVGVDFSLLNRRVTGYVDVYSDRSESLLIDVLLAPSIGFGSYKENLGKIENSGVEVSLRVTPVKVAKGLQWDLFGTLLHNRNRLLELNDALLAFNKKQDENQAGDDAAANKPPVRYQEGKSINTIWANHSLGIDPYTGKEIFLDRNGERVEEWSANNYMPLGCRDPKVEGTFGTMLSYKGFQLNAYFRYSYGGDIYNQTLVDKVENVNPLHNADRRVLYDRWSTPGVPARFKAITNTQQTRHTSRFIEKDNYIQLSSLSLAYRFDPRQLSKIGIEQLRLIASGENIFRASTVKMERGTGYPFARTYSLSAQLTF